MDVSGTHTTARCSSGHKPVEEFWREKITRNTDRDRIALSRLKDQGWRVLTVWECALRGPGRYSLDHVLQRCENFVLDAEHEFDEISGSQRRQPAQT